MSEVLAVVIGITGFITILAIFICACFSETETFKAVDKMIAEHIKSNADQCIQDVEVEQEDRAMERM